MLEELESVELTLYRARAEQREINHASQGWEIISLLALLLQCRLGRRLVFSHGFACAALPFRNRLLLLLRKVQ